MKMRVVASISSFRLAIWIFFVISAAALLVMNYYSSLYTLSQLFESIDSIEFQGHESVHPGILEADFNQWMFEQRMKVFGSGGTPVIWQARNDYSLFLKMLGEELDDGRVTSDEERKLIWNNTKRFLVHTDNMCVAVRDFRLGGSQKRHVAIMHLNENWGALSYFIPNRTVNWGSLEGQFIDCSFEEVVDYLDNPNTLAIVTTQHQSMAHPKIHSIPLGLMSDSVPHLKEFTNKTKLLMINSSPSDTRLPQMETVIRNFHGTVNNTYGETFDEYIAELQQSKFVMSPSGMGWDCYRNWEALMYGAIPVIEHYNRTDGWFRTFDGLPVAWVLSYDHLTPEFLEAEYTRLSQYRNYTFEKLTSEYWINFVHSFNNDNHTL